ncbi:MAG TPA: 2Fe-2S iron-sulfur cluster-binding protein [Chitinophagaceae bacterium]|nr:2Fe-2S iron-sulfur cluster-binding protein [Chitinophagaceae bacterium]
MYTIEVNFEQPELRPILLKSIEGGQSLLEVLLKNNIELHHNCGGVCACSSCHLYIIKGCNYLEEVSNRENAFIKRAINPQPNSRLACQCLLLDGGQILEVRVPNQRMISDATNT